MRKSKMMLAAAVAGLGLTASSQAAMIVGSLSLLKPDLTPVPQVGGVYQLTQGDAFKVAVEISIPDPNITRANRGTTAALNATENKPLGAATVSAQVLSGANGVVVPVGSADVPPRWTNDGDFGLVDQTLEVIGAPWVNLNALGDSDLDVDGAGFSNTNQALTTAAGLNGKQYGAAGGPFEGPYVMSLGDYTAPGFGLTDLVMHLTAGNVYQDSASGTGVQIVVASGLQDGVIQLNVAPIPEPTALGLLSLGGLALARRRRA